MLLYMSLTGSIMSVGHPWLTFVEAGLEPMPACVTLMSTAESMLRTGRLTVSYLVSSNLPMQEHEPRWRFESTPLAGGAPLMIFSSFLLITHSLLLHILIREHQSQRQTACECVRAWHRSDDHRLVCSLNLTRLRLDDPTQTSSRR